MFAPHAVDIAVIISSLIASRCITIAEPFNDIFLFVMSSCDWSAEIQTKVYDPRSTDRPTDQASEFALAHVTPTSHSAK